MPWKVSDVMDQKTEFVLRAMRRIEPFGELCREYGISRKTGYKWKERFFQQGFDGLREASRRPDHSPTQASEDVVCEVVKLKTAHPGWGPKKIRALYGRAHPGNTIPSESTFKRILEKAGLVTRRRRRPVQEAGFRLTHRVNAERPNQVWTVDFKGWWYTQDRRRFEPLTIRDAYSRYVLCAQALPSSCTEVVQQQFHNIFDQFGLPEVIRSDNGAPFAASNSPLGLSRLSAWWLTLGIDLDRIRPSHPEENGGHERMHGDIARELQGAARADIATQQASLDVWRETFNNERPHEAIGMKVPRDLYQASPRKYDPENVELVYPQEHLIRKISKIGCVKVNSVRVNVSQALRGYEVGLEPRTASRFDLWFCRLCLGEVDLATAKFQAVTEGLVDRQ